MKYENEEQIRKDFARIFGWMKKRNAYDYGDSDPRTPEWAEIFAEIGKLKEDAQKFYFIENLKGIEQRLLNLEMK